MRPAGAGDALVLIDATSGAGGLPVDVAPGRRLLLRAAEVLRLRRRAVARAAQPGRDRARRRAGRRPTAGSPSSLSLATALDNSRKDQTYNTPAVATLLLLADQLDWMLGQRRPRRLRRAHARDSSSHLYGWAEAVARSRRRSSADPAKRSLVVGTIDFDDEVDAAAVAATLRANGIVDTEPYRKLGRNQLRIGMFPAIDPADVAGAHRLHRLGRRAAGALMRVLVAEKIGASGVDAAARALRRRRRLDGTRDLEPHRRVRRRS